MGEFDGFSAIALDVDGTLARADHQVSARSYRVLAALESHGVHPFIVTGRTAEAARVICHRAGLTAPFVAVTGAVVEDPVTGERLRAATMPAATVERILGVIETLDLVPIVWTAEGIHAAEPSEYSAELAALTGATVRYGPLDDVVAGPVVKLVAGGPAERLDALVPAFAERAPELSRCLHRMAETMVQGATKADGVRLVCARLGVALADCIGIGDNDTDADWLSIVGLPVAVANARPSVRAVAERMIGHHDEDAVAVFLEEVLASRTAERS